MENPDWLVGIRVCRISQVVYPSTVIDFTKLYKKLLAILLYAYGAVERQQGSKVSVWLQVEQQSVSSDGSAVPASGSDSGSNIRSSIYRLVIKSQAYRRNHSVG